MGRDGEDVSVPAMRSTLWVGRVKSTVPPDMLKEAFEKHGPVRKVETGFAGFAFVEYEEEEDSDKACEHMNKYNITGIGEIRVSRATYRGYTDACSKRVQYWRSRGHKDTPPGMHPRDHDSRRSPSVRRRRPRSRSASRSGSRRRSRTWSRPSRPSRSRSRSSIGSRRRQRSRSKRSGKGSASPERSRSRSSPKRQPSQELAPGTTLTRKAEESVGAAIPPPADAGPAQTKTKQESGQAAGGAKADKKEAAPSAAEEPEEGAAAFEMGSGGQLSCADRAAMVCFFDGSNACDLLLEGASVLKLPDFYIPYMLNGFPHGFQGLSQEDGMKLLDVMAGICRGDTEGDEAAAAAPVGGEERQAEVRQTLLVDARGRRIMRKCLLINGQEVCSEEQTI